MMVTRTEMFCLPGNTSRARAPMMRPTMMALMMVPIMMFSFCEGRPR
jgi:hypothetical protein